MPEESIPGIRPTMMPGLESKKFLPSFQQQDKKQGLKSLAEIQNELMENILAVSSEKENYELEDEQQYRGHQRLKESHLNDLVEILPGFESVNPQTAQKLVQQNFQYCLSQESQCHDSLLARNKKNFQQKMEEIDKRDLQEFPKAMHPSFNAEASGIEAKIQGVEENFTKVKRMIEQAQNGFLSSLNKNNQDKGD